MSICQDLRILEPLDFFALSEAAQAMWIDHKRNLLSGAYSAPADGADAASRAARSAQTDADWRRRNGGV